MRTKPWQISDFMMGVMAVAVMVGAWLGSQPDPEWAIPRWVGVLSVVVAVGFGRPVLVAAAGTLLAMGLAVAAMGGLQPPPPGAMEGTAVLITDPTPLDGGGTRVELRVDGQRFAATAFGGAAGRLQGRLAGERIRWTGRQQPIGVEQRSSWQTSRRVVGRLALDRVALHDLGTWPYRWANEGRRRLVDTLDGVPLRSQSLITGVVYGDDRWQHPEVTDDFRAAGLTHLLAVSGQNVAYVIALAGPVLRQLRWRTRMPVTVMILVSFALVVRFEPSVCRAGMMAAVATLAAAVARPSPGVRLLALSVIILVLVDPLLVRSLGFALSVLASGGILLGAGPLAAVLPGPRWLREPLGVTLAAQLATAPLILLTFGPIPLASIPANLLAVPVAGALMSYGLLAGLMSIGLDTLVGSDMAQWPVALLQGPSDWMARWLAVVAQRTSASPLGLVNQRGLAASAAGIGLWRLWNRKHPRDGESPTAVNDTVTVDAEPMVPGRGPPRRSLGARVAGWSVVFMVLILFGGIEPRWRPAPAGGTVAVSPSVTLWGDATNGSPVAVLMIDGPGGVAPILESLRNLDHRCVDAVVVSGGGPSAAKLANALHRRCGIPVLAPEGAAYPGWNRLGIDQPLVISGVLVVSVDREGSIHLQNRCLPPPASPC